MPGYRVEAVMRVERTLNIDRRTMDRLQVRTIWERAMAPAREERTLTVVRRTVDTIKNEDQIGRVLEPRSVSKLPDELLAITADQPELVVSDPKSTRGGLHLRSYLEVTPPEVIMHAVRVWEAGRRQLGLPRKRIAAWDPTAGACTALTIVSALGGKVVCTDLTNAAGPVIMCDAREIGTAPSHKGKNAYRTTPFFLDAGVPSIANPDIVLIDPPSRGVVTHARLYGNDEHEHLDLATLDREEWISEVTNIVSKAMGHVAQAGVVSLVVRAGVRHENRVIPDADLVGDVRSVLQAAGLQILADVPVTYTYACKQTSAARERAPMQHLVLGRSR
jgi:hypothetical protein